MNDPETQPARVFYGWVVVAATFAVMMSAYVVQFSFGVFLPAVQAETGWTRETLTRAFGMYVFLYGAGSFVAGRVTDRFGPRRVMVVGAALLGLGYVSLSRVTTVWELYLFLGVVAAAGMSATPVPCSATVIRWFERQRGQALGIMMMGQSVGGIIGPPLAAWMIAGVGWRATYAWLGLGAAALIAVSAYFVVRDPKEMGLRPDGGGGGDVAAPARGTSSPPHYPWSLREARRTPTLWWMVLLCALSWLVVFVPVVHIAPYAIDLGIEPIRAAWLISAIGLGGALGRPLVGALSDRIGRVPGILLTLGTEAVVFCLLPVSSQWWVLCLCVALFGFAYAAHTTLIGALIGDYYGPVAVGSIVGFVYGLAGSMAAFGPWWAAYLVDTTGSYHLAFWIGAALNAVAFGLVFLLRAPSPPAQVDGAL